MNNVMNVLLAMATVAALSSFVLVLVVTLGILEKICAEEPLFLSITKALCS
jgi:hypothetical protein